MIVFGEHHELATAPYLIKATEQEEHIISFVVSMAVVGEKGTDLQWAEGVLPPHMIQEAAPIYADEGNLYEIVFEDYVFHMTRNESYAAQAASEIQKGDFFVIYERSALLDWVPQIVETEIVKAFHPKGWMHYGIHCQNHVIDVISPREPTVRKL